MSLFPVDLANPGMRSSSLMHRRFPLGARQHGKVKAVMVSLSTAAPPGGRNIAIRRAVQRGTLLLAERYAAERCNARRA